jgi:hypothetical protein
MRELIESYAAGTGGFTPTCMRARTVICSAANFVPAANTWAMP